MKITLVQPAMGRKKPGYVKSWQMEPLSMATLSALTPDKHEVSFFDDRTEVIDYDHPTDLVAITAETYTAQRAYQIATEYRKRGARVVMGGYHPSFLPDEAGLFADAVAVGDAEPVWQQIIKDAENNSLQKIYKAPQANLDELKIDRGIFGDRKYVSLTLTEAGRGCKFVCDFCSITSFSGGTYRSRPPAEVAREIAEAGRKNVFLVDDNFAADLDRAKEFLKALTPLRIRWIGQASLHATRDKEFMSLLAKSGCKGLLIGFESLNPETLKAMKKGFNQGVSSYSESVAILRDHGIPLYATFVFGYDQDTPDSLKRTLDFALEEKFMITAFNHLQPFPGTGLYKRLQEEGRLRFKRWWLEPDYTFGTIAFEPKHMGPDELYSRLVAMRQEFFSYKNIFKRSLDPANNKDPFTLWMHYTVNVMLRGELEQKWSLPVGDRTVQALDPAILDNFA
ncbi:B12-binding domain-containing radical SAM protein [Myxococcota bacterium]|nr:B12-binding domain-containing radical SAM protein [Myxococcota bacterium]